MNNLEKITVLSSLEYSLKEEEFYKHIHMEMNSRRSIPVQRILDESKSIPKPKVIYHVCESKIIDDSNFSLEGIIFKSSKVVKKIKNNNKIFANIVTSGIEIEEYCMTMENMLEQYIAMELCNFACEFAQEVLIRDVKERYKVELKEFIYPGEDGFALDSGKRIFELFSNREEEIGVSISEMGIPSPSRTSYSLAFGK
jgi:hypothetical protein